MYYFDFFLYLLIPRYFFIYMIIDSTNLIWFWVFDFALRHLCHLIFWILLIFSLQYQNIQNYFKFFTFLIINLLSFILDHWILFFLGHFLKILNFKQICLILFNCLFKYQFFFSYFFVKIHPFRLIIFLHF